MVQGSMTGMRDKAVAAPRRGRKRRLSSLAGCCLALATIAAPVQAQVKGITKDRAALAACLDAAKAARKSAESCVGTVQDACAKESGNESSAAMSGCVGREVAVWDERLNTSYKAALAGDLARRDVYRGGGARKRTGAEVMREAQRAWIGFRERKCSAARLPMEGGSGAALLGGACFLQETARQAIWLETLDEER
jgi:uncharacterized protein YecT (DUF1311 family)